jgi:NADP-dependent 3-hydroxy acid dehydrogenase YdfG
MEDLTFEQWSALVGVNLTGAFLCAQEAIRLMKVQQPQGGRIINNGSISARVPRPNSAPYAATEMTERMSHSVPQAGGSTLVESRMDVSHVAEAVLYMANLPLAANVEFMTVMATKMPFIGCA